MVAQGSGGRRRTGRCRWTCLIAGPGDARTGSARPVTRAEGVDGGRRSAQRSRWGVGDGVPSRSSLSVSDACPGDTPGPVGAGFGTVFGAPRLATVDASFEPWLAVSVDAIGGSLATIGSARGERARADRSAEITQRSAIVAWLTIGVAHCSRAAFANAERARKADMRGVLRRRRWQAGHRRGTHRAWILADRGRPGVRARRGAARQLDADAVGRRADRRSARTRGSDCR